MQVPQNRYIQVGSVNTRYWVAGEGSPVILLYGLGGFIETWLLNFDALAAQHRVYALDYVGHGKTDQPPSASYQLTDLAQFVKDFMAALEIERAHFIGQSLSGAITLQFALNHPTCIDKIVLADSYGLGKRGALILQLATLPLVGEIILSLAIPSDLEKYKTSYKRSFYNSEAITDELLELFYPLVILPGRQQAILKTGRTLGNLFGLKRSVYEPLARGLPTITNPVLVIWGWNDKVLPLAHAQAAVGALPNACLETIDNCGHVPQLEQPQIFNQLVLEFLKES